MSRYCVYTVLGERMKVDAVGKRVVH